MILSGIFDRAKNTQTNKRTHTQMERTPPQLSKQDEPRRHSLPNRWDPSLVRCAVEGWQRSSEVYLLRRRKRWKCSLLLGGNCAL